MFAHAIERHVARRHERAEALAPRLEASFEFALEAERLHERHERSFAIEGFAVSL